MEKNYLYQVFDDKNNEFTELKTNKSMIVICQLTELLYNRFVGKCNLKLKTIKYDNGLTVLKFTDENKYTYKITIPTKNSQLDYYRLAMDIKNDM